MIRIFIAVVLICVFALSGCVTTQQPASSETVSLAALQNCQSRAKSMELEITRLKDENFGLRKQLEAAQDQEVRMPSAMEIQTALKKAGFFKGVLDGKIGPETKEAVKKFQQANGMTPDGVVGSKTWGVLSKYLGN